MAILIANMPEMILAKMLSPKETALFKRVKVEMMEEPAVVQINKAGKMAVKPERTTKP